MRKTFLILMLTAFTALLGNGIIVPLLPGYADSMGASGVSIGLILAGYSASRAITMPFIGRLSDRVGRRKVFIVVGLLLCTVFSLGYIWATNIVALILVRVFHGIAAGLVVPIARTYVGDLSPEGEEATWMSYFNASFLAGIGVGPRIFSGTSGTSRVMISGSPAAGPSSDPSSAHGPLCSAVGAPEFARAGLPVPAGVLD